MKIEVSAGVWMTQEDFKKVESIFPIIVDLAKEHAKDQDKQLKVFLSFVLAQFVEVFDEAGTMEEKRAKLLEQLSLVFEQAEAFCDDIPIGCTYKIGRIEAVLA